MIPAGFYFGPHDSCMQYGHHRHPLRNPDGSEAPQPVEYSVTIEARATFVVSMDLDGTVRVRGGDITIDKGKADMADIRQYGMVKGHPWASLPAGLESDDAWVAIIEAIPDEGEVMVPQTWPNRPAPILDDEDEEDQDDSCTRCGHSAGAHGGGDGEGEYPDLPCDDCDCDRWTDEDLSCDDCGRTDGTHNLEVEH